MTCPTWRVLRWGSLALGYLVSYDVLMGQLRVACTHGCRCASLVLDGLTGPLQERLFAGAAGGGSFCSSGIAQVTVATCQKSGEKLHARSKPLQIAS